jgi:hypothetical protein
VEELLQPAAAMYHKQITLKQQLPAAAANTTVLTPGYQ